MGALVLSNQRHWHGRPSDSGEGRTNFFISTPEGKNNYFAPLFLDFKPGDGIHRIIVRCKEIPRLAEKAERMPRTFSATNSRQEIEVEMMADGKAFFDLSIIE